MRATIKEIVSTYKRTQNVSQTAASLGISRSTVHRWLKRARSPYGRLKYLGVHRLSTKPKSNSRILTPGMETQILLLKKAVHFGPKKIVKHLRLSVSHMVVHRLLAKKGLVVSAPKFRRPLFQNGSCMRPANTTELGFLQMDTKHLTPEWSGLSTTVYEYSAIDILSRFRQAVLLPDISDESARLAMEYFLKWFPFPVKYVQTDNGLEFQRTFHNFCLTKDINHYFIHKNSPNENAVIERSFRTDQDEFYSWLERRPLHIGELNEWLTKFITQYNHIRPHQSLDYKTPAEVVKQYTLQAVA